MSDVTRILASIDAGDPQAAEQLLPLVYDELRKLAAARLAHEKPGQTLQATALVHEAYLRLVGPAGPAGQRSEVGGQKSEEPTPTSDLRLPTSTAPSPQPLASSPFFSSRGHFFAAAAEAMRRILVEAARRRNSQKRGGEGERVELTDSILAADEQSDELLAIHEALDRLESHDRQAAQLVKLRYFVGMQHQEAADALGISRREADGLWTLARTWLRRELKS
jgi:RNA polymerase sigma factor (sigma-70 family)